MLVLCQFCLGNVLSAVHQNTMMPTPRFQWLVSYWTSGHNSGYWHFPKFFSLVSLIFSSCCWDFFKRSWWQGCREKPVLVSQVMALCDCQLYVLSGLCQEYAGEFIGMLERYSWRHLILFSLLLISWFRNQCCWGLLNSRRFCSKASLRTSAVATLLTVTRTFFVHYTLNGWEKKPVFLQPCLYLIPFGLIYYTSIIKQSGSHKSTEHYFSLILSWEEWVQTFGLQWQGKTFIFSVNFHT